MKLFGGFDALGEPIMLPLEEEEAIRNSPC
jgi:hypothetical protein